MSGDQRDWDAIGLVIARSAAEAAQCTRRRVGAIVMGEDHAILGAGWNEVEGPRSCLAGDCPRGRHAPNESRWHRVCFRGFNDPFGPHRTGWFARDQEGDYEFCSDCVVEYPCICDTGVADSVVMHPCPWSSTPREGYDNCPGTHAEEMAAGNAGYSGSVMYVTCEPCPQCVEFVQRETTIKAIIWPGGTVAFP